MQSWADLEENINKLICKEWPSAFDERQVENLCECEMEELWCTLCYPLIEQFFYNDRQNNRQID